jgi:hypothetical protein
VRALVLGVLAVGSPSRCVQRTGILCRILIPTFLTTQNGSASTDWPGPRRQPDRLLSPDFPLGSRGLRIEVDEAVHSRHARPQPRGKRQRGLAGTTLLVSWLVRLRTYELADCELPDRDFAGPRSRRSFKPEPDMPNKDFGSTSNHHFDETCFQAMRPRYRMIRVRLHFAMFLL